MKQVPQECSRLAAELRALRTRSGLSLAALGARTSYSKSSWERYLNGKALPPWAAVSALCGLADEPEPKARALWELAEAAWCGRDVVAAGARAAAEPEPPAAPVEVPVPPPAPAAAPEPTAGRPTLGRRWLGVVVALCVVLVCAAVTAGTARRLDSGQQGASPTPTAFHVKCSGQACSGEDPGTMLCGVQPDTLLQSQTAAGAGLEIRYDPQCRAAWARVWNTRIGDRITITAPGQPTRSVTVKNVYAATGFLYTPMVAVLTPNLLLRACVTPPGGGPSQCITARAP